MTLVSGSKEQESRFLSENEYHWYHISLFYI